MDESIDQLLAQMARRGSWVGGGSAAALVAAVAAALLEKLATQPTTIASVRQIRHACLRLVRQDATTFARVIRATRTRQRQGFEHALHAATDIQARVLAATQQIRAAGRGIRRAVKPRFQSDLRCAMYLAQAAGESARTLIATNRAWLAAPSTTTRPKRRRRQRVLRRQT